MKIDLPTLLLALTIASSVLAAAVMLVAARSRGHRGLTTWGLGLVVNALSYPAFGLRALGWLEVSVILTNLLTALSIAFHAGAVAAFQTDRAVSVPKAFIRGLVVANVLGAALLVHADQIRNVLVAAIQCGLAVILLFHALAPGLREARFTGRWVIVTGAAMLVLALGIRMMFMISATRWDVQYKVPDSVQALTYLAVLTVLLINTIGFVLMQMEYALSQQHELAIRDGLTGVYNRRALIDALERYTARARRDAEPIALLMIDIDHFKAVNDRYGHPAGDEVLRAVAQRVLRRMRQSDLLARYGGEEFVAVLPNTDVGGATRLAESIRHAVASRPVLVEGQLIPVAVSIGVHAGAPTRDEAEIEALIRASDVALYRAKASGRNCVAVE